MASPYAAAMIETRPQTLSERADALEHEMLDDLNRKINTKSVLYEMGDGQVRFEDPLDLMKANPGQVFSMGADCRLPRMPDKPTLVDFLKLRCDSTQHLLQSARHARNAGLPEKTVFACLLHDIAVVGFIRCDHGYWGAQMLEPYVDEEVSWAIRAHQALRFFPDESVGYKYPESYIWLFGPDYQPDPHIVAEYERARDHKWYMTSRMITCYDLYSFDPSVKIEVDEFADLIGRHFRQPEEGLGFDNTPASHMWRTMNWPTRFL